MAHDTRASWHDQPIPVLTAQLRTDVQQGLTPARRRQHGCNTWGPNALRQRQSRLPAGAPGGAVPQPGDLGADRGRARLCRAWRGGRWHRHPGHCGPQRGDRLLSRSIVPSGPWPRWRA